MFIKLVPSSRRTRAIQLAKFAKIAWGDACLRSLTFGWKLRWLLAVAALIHHLRCMLITSAVFSRSHQCYSMECGNCLCVHAFKWMVASFNQNKNQRTTWNCNSVTAIGESGDCDESLQQKASFIHHYASNRKLRRLLSLIETWHLQITCEISSNQRIRFHATFRLHNTLLPSKFSSFSQSSWSGSKRLACPPRHPCGENNYFRPNLSNDVSNFHAHPFRSSCNPIREGKKQASN